MDQYQSPYKGFNSLYGELYELGIEYQSPYKGFNRKKNMVKSMKIFSYQSPYKGFNRTR